jgi:hypothetical protein
MSKKTTTISISVPITIDGEISRISEEIGVSKSAICTAMISVLLKFGIEESIKREVIKHGKA